MTSCFLRIIPETRRPVSFSYYMETRCPVFSVLYRDATSCFLRIIPETRRPVSFLYYTETQCPVFSVLYRETRRPFFSVLYRDATSCVSRYYSRDSTSCFLANIPETWRPVFSLLFQRHDESFPRFLQQSGIAIAHIWALHVVLFCLHLAIVSTNKICRTKYAFLVINLQKAGTFLSCY